MRPEASQPSATAFRTEATNALAVVATVCASARSRVQRAEEQLARTHTILNRQAARIAQFRQWRVGKMLRDGRLPRDRPAAVYHRPGKAERCVVCTRGIGPTKRLVAIWARDGEPVAYLDFDCFKVWESVGSLPADHQPRLPSTAR